jgi:molybdopterin/thiamine biosynthesis adenylyltransferase
MKLGYEDFFQVNFGIFSPEEIKKIRKTRVFIGGCGGVGGAMSIILTRSGVENFVLCDPGRFKPSNMNRQITCFVDTLGKNKAEITAEEMKRINPEVKVEVSRSELEEVEKIIPRVDVVVPAADDFAWSIMVARAARKNKKPAVIAYPTGMLGRVTVIPPNQAVERFFGLPPSLPYSALSRLLNSPRLRKMFRHELEFYRVQGSWREEWFNQFLEAKVSLPQICPIVWATASIASLEVLKLATGKFKPVEAPKHWYITPEGASIKEFKPPSVGSKLLKVMKIARD